MSVCVCGGGEVTIGGRGGGECETWVRGRGGCFVRGGVVSTRVQCLEESSTSPSMDKVTS